MINKIDTRHGTANQQSFSNGNCLPYTGVPFGMNYFSIQTSNERGSWWFHPEEHIFQGYRLTHQPSPWMGDFSHLLLTPFSGELTDPSIFKVQSSYRPDEALFKPFEINISQLRYQISSKLVPSMYGAILEINYTHSKNGLLLTLPGLKKYKQLNEHELVISIVNFSDCEDLDFTFYLSLHFDNPFQNIECFTSDDENDYLIIHFENINHQILHLGTSFICFDQAILNRKREQHLHIDHFRNSSVNQWKQYFDKFQVEFSDSNHEKTFYHNLYRLLLFPQTFYEINDEGNKIHYDTTSKSIKSGILYTNNGFWDTYKTVYPLFSLFLREKYEEILEGILNSYKEAGFLPKWLSPDERGLMPGTLIDAVIADAAVKGIKLELMPDFLNAMIKSATTQSKSKKYGRQGALEYLKYGYVPSNFSESVNHTLDYAYSDYCISKVADVLGMKEVSQYYADQSLNYKNIFDKEYKFMRAKDVNGQFRTDFSPISWGKDYAEGSAWQSSFAVYQDFNGLISIFGGKEAFTEKLINLCNQEPIFDVGGYGYEIHEMSEMAAVDFGQLAISNQPSFHYPFLFNYIGKPEMAQPLIKNLLTQCFNASYRAYPGDEDNGSMAGWYIFNALGFYPVTPGSGEYVIGMPLIKEAHLKLSSGNILTIRTNKNKPQHQFIHEIYLKDKRYQKLYFTHNELMEGGEIFFELGTVPHPKKYQKSDLPFSLSK
ncbi:GH92 family glycosyl hydrolase [Enterococcus cecorum]|uniref:GH92 family glycosyl hydrolase n=3 Tax=Enterococcus cecorum TaxID=44008 RepID=UPI001FAC0F0A|nr:GH92 family glycosyl hydrolase [Enterococcus cecorum]MCJ0536544.1 GH92 family glycosyl hydrolase [Enterococcus cecorum]MCJ0545975.1 GH92 family glycosyl hydrolase [Enterococcus cecorum]MCJ0570093.1 GH92 family glycosyl hydrolase [Enterococcus cecorum]